MENEWQKVRIDNIKAPHSGAIAIGPFGSRMKADVYVDSGTPVIRGNNLGGRQFTGDFVYVPDDFAAGMPNCLVSKDDLVFPHRGAIGEVGIVSDETTYIISTSLMKLSLDKEQADPSFVFHFFKSEQGRYELLKNASTVGTPGIGTPLTSLRNIEIPLPPLPIQRQIAAILSAFDNKIELNRQMNRTLEQMARVLFKSWFVDFDPVRAKMRGEMPEGMDAETAAMFSDELIKIEGQEMPKGWTRGKIGDIAAIQNGFAFKSADWKNSGIPVVKIGSVKPGIVDLQQVSYVSEEVAHVAKRFRLNVGDLIIGLTGYVGEVGFIPPTHNLPLLNQRVGRFKIHNPKNFSYLWQLTRTTDFKDAVISKSHGSAQANVSTTAIENIDVLIPTQEILTSFELLVFPLIEKFLHNSGESAELAHLRDVLLPRLLSGEVDIRDWETVLESASGGQA